MNSGLIVLGCLVILPAAIIMLIFHIWDCVTTKKALKERREHAIFFGKAKELSEMSVANIHFYNNEIAPLKKKISEREEKLRFLPKAEKVKEEIYVECLKEKLFGLEIEHQQKEFEYESQRDKLQEYAKRNNIQWW